jgi:hypothetical protein
MHALVAADPVAVSIKVKRVAAADLDAPGVLRAVPGAALAVVVGGVCVETGRITRSALVVTAAGRESERPRDPSDSD